MSAHPSSMASSKGEKYVGDWFIFNLGCFKIKLIISKSLQRVAQYNAVRPSVEEILTSVRSSDNKCLAIANFLKIAASKKDISLNLFCKFNV
eukprot:573592_1